MTSTCPLEHEFFRMATMFLACRAEQRGIHVPGMSGDKMLALVGEVDAWREMILIVEEWRKQLEEEISYRRRLLAGSLAGGRDTRPA